MNKERGPQPPDINSHIRKEPSKMSREEFVATYEQIMNAVREKEKKGRLDPSSHPYEILSPEEQTLHATDWKTFSRQRGYSEEDIEEYEYWLTLSGQRDNLPHAINDPWRRQRPNWAETLWKKHIDHAATPTDQKETSNQ